MAWLYGMTGTDGHLMTEQLLKEACRLAFGLKIVPEIDWEAGGKPYFPQLPQLHFSLSHSGGYALCALGSTPLGVDIEVVRPRRAGLPQRVFSPQELAEYEVLGGDWAAFATLWTVKEAAAKYTGRGLIDPLRTIAPPSEVTTGRYEGSDYRGALCVQGVPPAAIVWL